MNELSRSIESTASAHMSRLSPFPLLDLQFAQAAAIAHWWESTWKLARLQWDEYVALLAESFPCAD